MTVYTDSVQGQGCRYLGGHGFDVIWRDESTALR